MSADDKEKHSGKYSLKLVNNDLTDGQSISFHSTGRCWTSRCPFPVDEVRPR